MQFIQNLTLLSAQAANPESGQADAIASNLFLEITGIIICTIGVCLLIVWLFWFDGFKSLKIAPTRRCHRLLPAFAMGMLLLWMVLMFAIAGAIHIFMENQSQLNQEAVSYVALSAMQLGLIFLILLITSKMISRGLKGLGLNPVTLVKDSAMSAINLIAIYPLIMLGLWLVLSIGKLFNPEFSIEVHESLDLLTDARIGLRIMVVVFAVIIVPVFEELLFRGLLQTSIRCFSNNSLVAIIFTSLFFAILHPPSHFLALFVFSCGLGYAYERSGSLFRPILMHMLFNFVSISATLFMS